MDYRQKIIAELAADLDSYGFTVYLAKRGTYGFFTDGKRVVSFQCPLGVVEYSGNYSTDLPKQTGTGWKIEHGEGMNQLLANRLIQADAPLWAVRGAKWVRYTTPEEHLATYGASSGYVRWAP